MGAVWTEIRLAARSLTRSPTVSLCAILCLGLGIGATTAISSALSRALLLLPLMRSNSRISRIEGGVLVTAYVAYLFTLFRG